MRLLICMIVLSVRKQLGWHRALTVGIFCGLSIIDQPSSSFLRSRCSLLLFLKKLQRRRLVHQVIFHTIYDVQKSEDFFSFLLVFYLEVSQSLVFKPLLLQRCFFRKQQKVEKGENHYMLKNYFTFEGSSYLKY